MVHPSTWKTTSQSNHILSVIFHDLFWSILTDTIKICCRVETNTKQEMKCIVWWGETQISIIQFSTAGEGAVLFIRYLDGGFSLWHIFGAVLQDLSNFFFFSGYLRKDLHVEALFFAPKLTIQFEKKTAKENWRWDVEMIFFKGTANLTTHACHFIVRDYIIDTSKGIGLLIHHTMTYLFKL